MAALVHRFDPPERFVAGTVGEPGQRTFFLQARTGTRVTSVALEKQQVALLAERVDGLLDDLMGEDGISVPAVAPLDLEDTGPLEQPIVEEFRAGTMTLAWDPVDKRVVVEVFSLEADSADDDQDDQDDEVLGGTGGHHDPEDLAEPVDLEDPDQLAEEVFVVRITAAVARAFAKRSLALVAAGRPSCQFCGGPMDPSGHLCPRANGFRRTPR